MVAIKTERRVDTGMMEVHASLTNVWYEEKVLEDSPLWHCSECGLLWDRKSYAEDCGEGTYLECSPLKRVKRNHRSSFPMHYGGRYEHMLGSPERYIPAATYIRQAHGRVKVK